MVCYSDKTPSLRCNMRVVTEQQTTLTNADEFYHVAGVFSDGSCNRFSVASDGKITYSGPNGKVFTFVGDSDVESDGACGMHYALDVNGVIDTETMTPHTFLSPSKVSGIGINRLVTLNYGDELYVSVKCNSAGTKITAKTLYLTFNES